MSDILKRFGLTEDDWEIEISDLHLVELSRKHCSCWKLLPSHLELEPIVAKDIRKSSSNEPDQRVEFFRQWKERKGSYATYKKLVQALLDIDQREDAEYVCKLLKGSMSTHDHHLQQASDASESSRQEASAGILL